jgi:hypothetical protein
MKHTLVVFCVLLFLSGISQSSSKTKNVFIVTIDGIRCQEIFKGGDPMIINNAHYTADIDLAKLMYLDSSIEQNRKKLLPFFWNVIQQRGQLYGNRLYKNKVNVSNSYKFSYTGYNEILTGYPDIYVSSNEPKNNLNINVLEYLNSFDEFRNKVVAFTSWDIFPYILNKKRSGLKVNSGYDSVEENGSFDVQLFNKAQENLINEKTGTRQDFFRLPLPQNTSKLISRKLY